MKLALVVLALLVAHSAAHVCLLSPQQRGSEQGLNMAGKHRCTGTATGSRLATCAHACSQCSCLTACMHDASAGASLQISDSVVVVAASNLFCNKKSHVPMILGMGSSTDEEFIQCTC